MSPKTSVVNILKEPKGFDCYIGRAGLGFSGYYGNPYRIRYDGTREECLTKYKKYFYNRVRTDQEFKKRILELRGKRLGCFCAPRPCHGDIIAAYVDSLDDIGKPIPNNRRPV